MPRTRAASTARRRCEPISCSDRLPPPPSQPDQVLAHVRGAADRSGEYGAHGHANGSEGLQDSHSPTVARAKIGMEERARPIALRSV